MVISNGLNNKGGSIKIVLAIIIVLIVAAAIYLLLVKKPNTVVIQFEPSPTASLKPSFNASPTPTPTPDVTINWNIYENKDGGYSFKYPDVWNVVIHPTTEKGALFGPGAALSGSDGSVEPIGVLESGQVLKDFVKQYNLSIGSGSTSEIETIINGQPAIISILSTAGNESMEIKNASFQNNKQVFNISLVYHTNFTKYPADKEMLNSFDKLLTTFKFIQ